jgi:hypothetical protein
MAGSRRRGRPPRAGVAATCRLPVRLTLAERATLSTFARAHRLSLAELLRVGALALVEELQMGERPDLLVIQIGPPRDLRRPEFRGDATIKTPTDRPQSQRGGEADLSARACAASSRSRLRGVLALAQAAHTRRVITWQHGLRSSASGGSRRRRPHRRFWTRPRATAGARSPQRRPRPSTD